MAKIGIQLWFNQYVYRETMQSDMRSMALELRISEKTVEKALRSEDAPETALVFRLCLRMMAFRNIDLNKVFMRYFNEEQ